MIKYAPWLILALGGGIVGWGLWNQRQHPPRIVATGTVDVEDKAKGRKLTLPTRTIETGTIRSVQVELPNGTWIDCAGDCRETVLREHLEFWQERQRRMN